MKSTLAALLLACLAPLAHTQDLPAPWALAVSADGSLWYLETRAPGVRVVPAAQARIGGPRSWIQRVAGSGQRAAATRLDGQTLALPPVIAVFDDAVLNRELYLWLAVLAAVHVPVRDWVQGNQRATALAIERCPGLAGSWQRLRNSVGT